MASELPTACHERANGSQPGDDAAMAPASPLPALLSPPLVAFTIEFDNEFEHRMEHNTTARRTRTPGAPWLVSQVMWANVLQYLDGDGLTADELHARTRPTLDSVTGHQRWGYGTM